jgi:hypothetical protein
MIAEPKHRQNPGELIDVSYWEADTEFEYSLQGAKPKRTLLCPSLAPRGFLLGDHRYVFKTPIGRSVRQVWSEVIAYEVAKEVGIRVPPAFLAYDSRRGAPGVLMEFFYGYRGMPNARFVHAIELLQSAEIPVDFRHGSLLDNLYLCRALRIVGWKEWWAQTVAFDALIGNTDRHSENWGVLISPDAEAPRRYSLAPAFDNGTSLGADIRDDDVHTYLSPDRLEKFVRRGSHHVNWLSGSPTGGQHAELCGRFAEVYGAHKDALAGIFDLRDAVIEGIAEWCLRFEFPVRFTEQRAEFVTKLLKARRDAIIAAMGG